MIAHSSLHVNAHHLKIDSNQNAKCVICRRLGQTRWLGDETYQGQWLQIEFYSEYSEINPVG